MLTRQRNNDEATIRLAHLLLRDLGQRARPETRIAHRSHENGVDPIFNAAFRLSPRQVES